MFDSGSALVSDFQTSHDQETVVDDFKRQADTRSHDEAVVSTQGSLNYAELHVQSNQLAHFLQTAGVHPDTIVGILMDRSLDMMIALWAILKAGGAYLPLDPIYPPDRLYFMIDDTKPVVILTQPHLLPLVRDMGYPTFIFDRDRLAQERSDEIACPAKGEHLAYIIYTSGSTGKPKGVMISHGALYAFTRAAAAKYDLTPGDRVLQFGTISFDIAVEEMFPTWHSGGKLVLRPDILPPFRDFHAYLERQGITVLNLPTPFWHEWVLSIEQELAPPPPPCLRLVIVGADKAVPERLASWHRIVGRRVRWLNTYGPTETTVSATAYEPATPELGPDATVVAIGRPLANCETYVLDENGQRVANGQVGILYIGGQSLARGYLNQPELTRERFIPNPFRAHEHAQDRLYNTGDLVRARPDGNLEFLGRQDDQVKIRGFRIELGEIESVLRQHSLVADAVVRPYDYAPHDTRLIAYVVPKRGKNLTTSALHQAALAALPRYMCPVSYTILLSLPYNANGKIDRQGLPAPELMHLGSQTSVSPADPLTLQLTKIWENILNLPQIGVEDNFFDVGGNSLTAVRLFGRIEHVFGRSLPLATLLEAPTIQALVHVLRDEGWTPPWQCLVPIQPNGVRTPFFCVHAVGGNVLSLRELAHKLGEDQPFYALQSQGLNGQDTVPKSVEEMAAYYLDEIRTIQPHGPYLLGGQSSGGFVAFEMAQQLLTRGETIGLLAMIDTCAPMLDQFKRALPIARRVAFHLLMLRRHRLIYMTEKLREASKASTLRMTALRMQLLYNLGYYRDHTLPAAWRYRAVQHAIAQAIMAYTPALYPGNVTLFRATETFEAYLEDYYQIHQPWASLVSGCLVCHNIEGGHNLEKGPAVDLLADKLKHALSPSQPLLAAKRQTNTVHIAWE